MNNHTGEIIEIRGGRIPPMHTLLTDQERIKIQALPPAARPSALENIRAAKQPKVRQPERSRFKERKRVSR